MRRDLLCACLLAAAALLPAGARAAAPPAPLTLQFVPLEPGQGSSRNSDAFVDVGAVSAAPGRRPAPIKVQQRVGLRLEGPAASARVSVALEAEIAGVAVRVDGLPVTTIPRLIDPAHRIGATVVHRIEITIPAHVPPGNFLSNLQWLAESD